MSMQTKDNSHILANQQAFRDACARARAYFGQIEGVQSVGFGQKETGGVYSEDIAIIVYVNEKKSLEELSPSERIPPVFEGYKTDVVAVPVGRFLICDNSNKYETIVGGIRISPRVGTAASPVKFGTLGCIVRRRGDAGRENVYLLTCQHVLVTPESGANDNIYHPLPPPPPGFKSPTPIETLGPIQKGALRENIQNYAYTIEDPNTHQVTKKQGEFFIDCGIARINIDCKCWPIDSTCTKDVIKYDTIITDLQVNGKNDITDVRSVIESLDIIGKRVFKVGRTTGKTTGIVRAVDGNVQIPTDAHNPNSPLFQAKNLIKIDFDTAVEPENCKHHAWFAEQGDSGSIIVDEERRAIGLLVIGPPATVNGNPTPHAYPSYGCHILPVLDRLNICIPTATGASHGSCKATDGSGLALAQLSEAGGSLPDGQIVFTSQSAATLSEARPGFPDHAPVADEEFRHMRELLDSLRETEKGRELREVFGHVRREIGYLIRNCRPVKVAWHRSQGPAFMAHVLNHLKGHTAEVPHEIRGVSRLMLLTRMAEALSRHGSNPLRQAIEEYGAEFLGVMTSARSAEDCIAYLREKESA